MTNDNTGTEFSLIRMMGYLRVRRRQIAVFMVCVCISIFLWLMIKLNSHYIRTIGIQVSLTEVPENRKALPMQSSQVIIEIRAQGYQLLFNEITMLKHLDLDLSKALLKPTGREGVYFISTQSMLARIGSQLPASTQILSMKPDTLFFSIAEIMREKVPVKPDVTVNFPSPYFLYDTFNVTPDSVWIVGTRDKIQRVSSVSTRPFSLSKAQQTFSYKLNLINPYPDHIELQTKEVQLKGRAEKFSRQTWTLPVQYGDSVMLLGEPDYQTVVVHCLLPEENVAGFDPRTLRVNARRVEKEDGKYYCYPELSSPVFIKDIRITPSKIAIEPHTP